ncbi:MULTISPECIES: cytochrome b/b6 domain-containing protein [Brevibacterium]|uniref:Cytochrome b561 bacterial/Ni-hydrogenase domain-containing protein n=1 Tax=Brevibacterium salitolerans TaxID=1403566 RepID=A0ABN2X4U5_9MICO|nr:cytochrome b/b6 domain-containing protein [Brevibacterium sp.]
MNTSSKNKKKSGGFDFQPFVKPALIAGGAIVVLAILVGVAIWLRTLEPVEAFIRKYPGQSEANAVETGLPAWLGWQHFLNAFFMLLIIRTGILVRTTQRPQGHWTRNNKGLIKTKGAPKKISMNLWIHFVFDALWVLNGIVFYILLFSTGQWRRIVPADWDIFPHAVSSALQYASMNWPAEMGWTNYNGLQVLSYFLVVFVAAPLSLLTGLRMSNIWPEDAKINKFYPAPVARAIHFPTMVFFLAFIAVHVTLVFVGSVVAGHGLGGNLQHMYAASDDNQLLGFIMFAVSIVVMVAGWFLARPVFLTPLANMFGKVSR